MTYIFDSCVLISCHRNDLTFSQFESFWHWLAVLLEEKTIVLPEVVFGECERGNDELSQWLKNYKDASKIPSALAIKYLPKVLDIYGSPIEAKDLEKIQKDALIISHALVFREKKEDVTIVTCEKRKNTTSPGNKKIPNICSSLGIPYLSFPGFLWRELRTQEDE